MMLHLHVVYILTPRPANKPQQHQHVAPRCGAFAAFPWSLGTSFESKLSTLLVPGGRGATVAASVPSCHAMPRIVSRQTMCHLSQSYTASWVLDQLSSRRRTHSRPTELRGQKGHRM